MSNDDDVLNGYRFAAITTIAFVLLAIPFHLKPDNFIVDDGYFYPQIARNIVAGYGSTFNRVMPTNGYHPLWMVICVVAAYLVRSSTALIQVLGLVLDALVLLSLFLFIYICKTSRVKGTAAGIAIIIFMTTTLGIWRMLEADLSMTLQLAILALIVHWQKQMKRLQVAQAFLVGGLLGLAILARLDLVFFAAVVVFYFSMVFSKEIVRAPGQAAIRTFAMGACCCAVVFPYLYLNYHQFGHFLPISGAIKAAGHHDLHLPAYCIPVIIGGVSNVIYSYKNRSSAFGTVTVITSVSSVVLMAYSVVFGSIAAWYLTTGYLSVAFCAAWMVDLLLEKFRYPTRAVAYGGSLIALILMSLGVLRLISNFTYTRLITHNVSFRSGYVEPKRALAEGLKSIVPAGSRIYIFDGPGGVAYYSGMSIIPVDGLVGDYAYNRLLLKKGLSRFMSDERIDYIIAPVVSLGQTYSFSYMQAHGIPDGELINIEAPLYQRSAGSIVVRNVDMLGTFLTVVPDVERSFPRVAVWKVDHSQ